MRTRVWIGLFTLAGVIVAGNSHDLAAIYVALGAGAILYVLHAIEVKLNRLLNAHQLTVWDADVAKE